MFAFALTSLLMTGANTALTEDGATQHRVACYGLMYGGLAQILAAIYEMKRGSTFGATTFYTYGGYWVGLSLLTLLHDGGAGGLEGAQAAPPSRTSRCSSSLARCSSCSRRCSGCST